MFEVHMINYPEMYSLIFLYLSWDIPLQLSVSAHITPNMLCYSLVTCTGMFPSCMVRCAP